jgi:hypothetical protein
LDFLLVAAGNIVWSVILVEGPQMKSRTPFCILQTLGVFVAFSKSLGSPSKEETG